MALNLARDIVDADLAFRKGEELWGGDGNQTARLLSGADVGIIGFGDLGRALNRLLTGFRVSTKVFDPWLPPSILIDNGVEPASLDEVLTSSDFVFVVASVTSENQGFLGAEAFASMAKQASKAAGTAATIHDQKLQRGEGGELHQTASGSAEVLTTAQGGPVSDDQNSLRIGARGPTVLEDFHFREKIFHFDHERIPERVVHANSGTRSADFGLLNGEQDARKTKPSGE